MATAQIEPPPGFVLDRRTVAPPTGFILDRMDVPPPPPGFELDTGHERVSPSELSQWENETERPTASFPDSTAHLAPLTSSAFYPGREGEAGLYTPNFPTVSPLTGEQIPGKPGPSLNPLEPILAGVLPRYQPMPQMLFGPPSKAEQIAGGTYNALAGAAESVSSPAVLLSGGAAEAIPALARPVAAVWTAIMAKDIPKQVEQVNKVFKEDRPLEEKVEAATELGLSLAFTAGAAKGALTPRPTPGQVAGEMLRENIENTPFTKPSDLIAQPIVENLRAANAPATAAVVEKVLPESPKAPESVSTLPTPVSEVKTAPRPTPESAGAIPAQVPKAVETIPAAEGEFVYHATSSGAAKKIRSSGIQPGSWFAKTPQEAKAFVESENPVIFAVRKSELKPMEAAESDIFGQEFQKAGVFVRSKESHIPVSEVIRQGDRYILKPTPAEPAAAAEGKAAVPEAKPVYKATLYQGRGAPLEQIYGEEAVKEGRAAPIIGKADYFATTPKYAETYGKVSKHEVELRNPITIDSDASWRKLLQESGATVLDSRGREWYEHPERISGAGEKLQSYLRSKGYDGVIVNVPERADMNARGEITKGLAESFGHSQVVKFGEPAGERSKAAPEIAAPAVPTPPSEGAIAFPGIGSLREGDATPMRLGQIRKSDPALWKAITQHFGTDKPAKLAKLAKDRFTQMATAPKVKWTGATEEPPLGGATYGPFGIPSPAATIRAVRDLAKAAGPAVKAAAEAVKETGKEALTAGKMTDYRRSVLNWSAKLQRSFQEAADSQKEIQKAVPDPVRREGITNWIQAGGDPAVLRSRAAATTDLKLKAGYEAALNLTPEELAVANDVKTAFDTLATRGQHYDVLKNFRDNYVTQIWDLNKGPSGGATSRTLKDKFRFSKARTFESYFEGEQAGFTPKTKDISKLLPVYLHEMNSVIAARQLVEQMSKGVASDGRPLVAPRGVGIQVDGPKGQATLIIPKVAKGDRLDYKMLENQPALSDWVWRTEDSAGNPVFEKADLALHPEAYGRLKAVLGRSAIREWYSTPTSRVAAIPKAVVKAIDLGQSEVKRTMLGFFAPFHQVQEATHAVGHRVNPLFNVPKPDLVNNPAHMDAARHGLMLLPDRASEGQFMEGFKVSGIVSRIPGIGPLADWYSNYLFKEYIPGLKFKTYEAILDRNQKVYAKELASGTMRPEDVKVLSAEQSNAAYGHLNYADLARNPTMQHLMQLGLLAPDFLEARGRFAAQAVKGATTAKVGREQVVALATLAVAQATTAWIASQLVPGGQWDPKHPFELKVGSRTYTMRSVPEDLSQLIQKTRGFVNSRLSPVLGKGVLQYASGVDYAQRKVTAGQTTRELLTAPIPLTLRSIPAVQKLTGLDRPGQVAPLEQLADAMGLRISRNYPRQDLDELHAKFLEKHPDERVRANYEQHLTETTPVSQYKAVYSALADRNGDALMKAVDELEAKGWKLGEIKKRINPVTVEGDRKGLFYEKKSIEREFRDSLDKSGFELYEKALQERRDEWAFFQRYY